MRGVIERRILVNFRVDPDVLTEVLPAPFQPQLVDGFGIAGVCLIRLGELRPALLPGAVGLRSENAAHRIAVTLPDGSHAVYIPRRDTNSRVNVLVGGRLFPGVHHRARFTSTETQDRFDVAMRSDDGATRLRIESSVSDELPADSVFGNVADVSAFFEDGSLGFSDASQPGCFDGLELHTTQWEVTPLAVHRVESSFFDDRAIFPAGSATFDNALLMRNIAHDWRARPSLRAAEPQLAP